MSGGYGAEPGAVVGGGIAADYGSGGDVRGDAGLGGGYGSVADGEVAGYAYLAGEDDIFPYGRGASEAGLGAEQGVFAYGRAVAYLDEVVDFGSGADTGLADGGAVDGGVGLDFDGIFEDGGAGLDDLGPAAFGVLGEAEAVGSDDRAVLEHYVVA